ncbi:tetratricopeptide repeat protein [Kribbella sp. NPDC003505]|uniref:tetratricopeptide repeat protein n=1 Tax=Kribbella sp. NPDC003505 TaxID=3154448 RepID=UPI0033A5121B
MARADDPTADPVPAITRLGDYYLSGLLAVKQLILVLFPLPVTVSQPPPALPDLSSHDSGVKWMDTEWGNLTATLALAAQLRIDLVAVGLGQLATIAHARRGGSAHLYEALVASLPAAERLGDRRVLASHHYLHGVLLMRMGRLSDADPELRTARALLAAEGDGVGEAMAIFQLGELHEYDDAAGAVELLEQAVAVLPADESAVRGRVRCTLSHALVRLGKYEAAREVAADVLETADRQTARMCLDVLGRAALGLGDAQGALAYAEQAVAISQATGHVLFEANSLTDVAIALLHLGRAEDAEARQTEAVRILEEAGEPDRLVRAHLPYARACRAVGDGDRATRYFREALELATAHGLEYLVPEARTGLVS